MHDCIFADMVGAGAQVFMDGSSVSQDSDSGKFEEFKRLRSDARQVRQVFRCWTHSMMGDMWGRRMRDESAVVDQCHIRGTVQC